MTEGKHDLSSLDTSGFVLPFARFDPQWNAEPPGYRWSDLTPFTQGYVEALHHEWPRLDLPDRRKGAYRWAFSNLAPETLARIMEDCEAASTKYCTPSWPDAGKRSAGAAFWREELSKRATPYLGDDGLIYLRPRDDQTSILQGMKEEGGDRG